jgi:DNA topoisomerase-1
VCPKCSKPLVIRWGRNGRFMACSGYPECRHTKPLDAEEKIEGEVCKNCGRDMVVKVGRFGRFLACSGYPDCKTSRPYPIGVACPQAGCNGKIIERRSKRGRTFYGCSNYPACNFVSWNKPVAKPCPSCGNNYLEERYTQADGAHLRCPKCKEKFEANAEAVYEPAAALE